MILPATRRRVVITGIGCICPLGSDPKTVFEALVEGRSGVGPLTLFDASRFPVRIAAEVRDWDWSSLGDDPQRWQGHARQTLFALGSAVAAAKMAGLEELALNPLRLGVYLGCGETFHDLAPLAMLLSEAMEGGRLSHHDLLRVLIQASRNETDLRFEPSVAAGLVAGRFNAQGPSCNCIAACVSSSQAIGEAAEIIRRGDAEVMLAGGAHSMIHPLGIPGFCRLDALSQRNDSPREAMRPFDRERDGFVVGEGAAILVLEELTHALRRDADIWGELTGYGAAQDAYRVTDPHPEGRGAAQAIRRALDDARLAPEEIDYINAHGTSTVANDKMETAALKHAFGPWAKRIPVSSTKSMTGHLTTAGGALESAACLLSLRHNVLPPTINYHTPDPECDLDYVPNIARAQRCRHVLNNSFGFGGHNTALVFSRFDKL